MSHLAWGVGAVVSWLSRLHYVYVLHVDQPQFKMRSNPSPQ
jgi:hypothetical protein